MYTSSMLIENETESRTEKGRLPFLSVESRIAIVIRQKYGSFCACTLDILGCPEVLFLGGLATPTLTKKKMDEGWTGTY